DEALARGGGGFGGGGVPWRWFRRRRLPRRWFPRWRSRVPQRIRTRLRIWTSLRILWWLSLYLWRVWVWLQAVLLRLLRMLLSSMARCSNGGGAAGGRPARTAH